MAAFTLCWRTAVSKRTVTGIKCSKTLFSMNLLSGNVLQAASYNPKPLKLNLKGPFIPDKDSEKTPQWQKTDQYDRKLFGRLGSVSGVDPASLWPKPENLERIITEEQLWHPSLEEMLKNIRVRDKQDTEARQAREKLIAANMAKMPKMVADWRREKHEAKQKQKEEKARREKLLVQARERFGHTVDPRSSKFIDMVAEIEKEEKKKQKLMKRRLKEEKAAAA